MKKYNLKTEQNIIDLAIQEYGSADAVFKIIEDNKEVGNINHIFAFGDTVLINEEASNLPVKKYFNDRDNLFVSTGELERLGDYNNDFNNDFNI